MLRLGGPDGIAVPARVLILALVLLFAFVITFPALRGYLSQQAQYDAVIKQLTQARATSTALESELAQWDDEAYVRAQARERLSYVMPGETTYVVVGADRLEDRSEQEARAAAEAEAGGPWYTVLRESAEVAGATGEKAPPEESQRGWSTSVPTIPTPTSESADQPAVESGAQ
ncbi:FtsB family cell division protein [Actinomyces faecalis]|uniref:FtsB family cell division protein n=1 Tax=Actinomyces faecalis TaxID=2722820 RepID=UPI001F48A5FF|nr:septum formation initiator family protein [Actinomyces faecalis]